MTPDQLTAALDTMQQAADGDAERGPGLITVKSSLWCDSLYAIDRITKTLDEGIRHRGIKVMVSSLFETKILTRAEAADRGAPSRLCNSEPRSGADPYHGQVEPFLRGPGRANTGGTPGRVRVP